MKLLSSRIAAIVLLALHPCLHAAERAIHRESTEWTDAWFPNTNASGLPRVLLIGDSITRAYFPEVEKGLAGKAYSARIATSKAIGDPALPQEIALFMSQARFDVVHLNIGMHGWAYSEADYQEYLPELVDAVRKAAPTAKLIWATTTPIRQDRANGASNARIERRNAIAKAYFESLQVNAIIDDLHSLMKSHAAMHTDDVHFGPEGNALLARQVVDLILSVLETANSK